MCKEDKYRHELKYEITYSEFLQLKSKLGTIMQMDENVGIQGTYKICSLYFDNYNDKALKEKINGISIRDKYRIRYYNDNNSFIVLEKKSKRNSLCLKKSCVVTKNECVRILNGDVEWIKEVSLRPLLRDFYTAYTVGLLRPKTIVTYMRYPFIYTPGNVRITFDMNIHSGLYHTDLFDLSHPLIPVLAGHKIILEIKYDEFLPDIIRMLIQSSTPRLGAFSKYASCRQYE